MGNNRTLTRGEITELKLWYSGDKGSEYDDKKTTLIIRNSSLQW